MDCNDCEEGVFSLSPSSGANDIVVVVSQANGDLLSTPVNVQISKFTSLRSAFSSRQGRHVKVVINHKEFIPDSKLSVGPSGMVCFDERNRFTTKELARMNLNYGPNSASFHVESLDADVSFNIYLLAESTKLVVTDIDGTITETSVRGFVFPRLGIDVHQNNVVELFQLIADNNYTVIYLTARSLMQDQATRSYLFETLQNQQGYSLPRGPLFMNPTPLTQFFKEVVTDQGDSKTKTLNNLLELFKVEKDVVRGAYGNADTDTTAYLKVGINPNSIYLVNRVGELRRVSDNSISSYKQHAIFVDKIYPKILSGPKEHFFH